MKISVLACLLSLNSSLSVTKGNPISNQFEIKYVTPNRSCLEAVNYDTPSVSPREHKIKGCVDSFLCHVECHLALTQSMDDLTGHKAQNSQMPSSSSWWWFYITKRLSERICVCTRTFVWRSMDRVGVGITHETCCSLECIVCTRWQSVSNMERVFHNWV